MSTAATPPRPTALAAAGDSLVIDWSDGVRHTLRWSDLRDACPCATCRAKKQEPPETPASFALPVLSLAEAQPVRARAVRPMGNYAYGIDFTDGHNTGIYSITYLRQLGDATEQ